MDIDPTEVISLEMTWDNGDIVPQVYSRDITRRQLGELLLQLDDMAADTEDRDRP